MTTARAEQMVLRGDAPIKREFCQQFCAPPPPADGEPNKRIAIDGENKRKEPDAVEPIEKLSKNRMKKQANAAKRLELCSDFLKSRCRFGDSCKWSHSVAAYVAAKPPDLPGSCPFEAAAQDGGCVYGVQCRYWRSHSTGVEPFALSDAPQQPALVAGAEMSDADYLAGWHCPDGRQAGTPGMPPVARPLPLPLPTSIAPEGNRGLGRDLMFLLRKNDYPFEAADSVLKSMGLAISAKQRQAGPVRPIIPTAAGESQLLEAGAVLAEDSTAVPEDNLPRVSMPTARNDLEDGLADGVDVPLRPAEKPTLDLRGRLYLAPLTTVGNLPFRRLCKGLGADVTCGEMALATNLLMGQASEWALLRRHPSEDLFGVQLAGGYPDALAHAVQLVSEKCEAVDFVDINCGCPIDLVCSKGAGACLMTKPGRLESIVTACARVLSCPLTIKVRMGYDDGRPTAHALLPKVRGWGAVAATIHGRSREQRYSRRADWAYIGKVADAVAPTGLQLVGNGDVMSYRDYDAAMEGGRLATVMIARGALIKPWVFTEIKERRDWDITAGERLDMLRRFAAYGLEHWGSDGKGVETTRRFLLEWLSFLHRYVPVGLLEILPQQLHLRPQPFYGRSWLESLMASPDPADWLRISTLLLGPPPPSFVFAPKHKNAAWGASGGAASESSMAFGRDDDVANG